VILIARSQNMLISESKFNEKWMLGSKIPNFMDEKG